MLEDEIVVPNFRHLRRHPPRKQPHRQPGGEADGANAGLTASRHGLGDPRPHRRNGPSARHAGPPGDHDLAGRRQRRRRLDPCRPARKSTRITSTATPSPGDWRGILIDSLANDRNVAVTNETEDATHRRQRHHDHGAGAGQLGHILNGGDENLRLGFEVHGSRFAYRRRRRTVSKPRPARRFGSTSTRPRSRWTSVVELVDANGPNRGLFRQ